MLCNSCNCQNCGFQTLFFFFRTEKKQQQKNNMINLSEGMHLVSDPLSFPGSPATPGITVSISSLCYFSSQILQLFLLSFKQKAHFG